jgi:hypothetical protein
MILLDLVLKAGKAIVVTPFQRGSRGHVPGSELIQRDKLRAYAKGQSFYRGTDRIPQKLMQRDRSKTYAKGQIEYPK